MTTQVTFVKPSLPFGPGDVVQFEDDKAASLLNHPMDIARKTTQEDIDTVYRKVGKTPPSVAAKAAGESKK